MYADQPDLQRVIADLQRQWGTNVVRPLADLPASTRLPVIPTGFPALDGVLACGGIPQQRLTVFSGSPTCGTTTLAYRLMAQAQHQQQVVVYLDLQRCFDPIAARRCGVESESLLLARPEDLTEALALLRDLVF
jgi:recombination protein RecA